MKYFNFPANLLKKRDNSFILRKRIWLLHWEFLDLHLVLVTDCLCSYNTFSCYNFTTVYFMGIISVMGKRTVFHVTSSCSFWCTNWLVEKSQDGGRIHMERASPWSGPTSNWNFVLMGWISVGYLTCAGWSANDPHFSRCSVGRSGFHILGTSCPTW